MLFVILRSERSTFCLFYDSCKLDCFIYFHQKYHFISGTYWYLAPYKHGQSSYMTGWYIATRPIS